MPTSPRYLRLGALPLAALLGLALPSLLGACQDDTEDEIASTCMAFCERSVECNPSTIDLDFCTDYCTSVLNQCPDDKRDAAIAGYDACASETCEALNQCSFDAESEC